MKRTVKVAQLPVSLDLLLPILIDQNPQLRIVHRRQVGLFQLVCGDKFYLITCKKTVDDARESFDALRKEHTDAWHDVAAAETVTMDKLMLENAPVQQFLAAQSRVSSCMSLRESLTKATYLPRTLTHFSELQGIRKCFEAASSMEQQTLIRAMEMIIAARLRDEIPPVDPSEMPPMPKELQELAGQLTHEINKDSDTEKAATLWWAWLLDGTDSKGDRIEEVQMKDYVIRMPEPETKASYTKLRKKVSAPRTAKKASKKGSKKASRRSTR